MNRKHRQATKKLNNAELRKVVEKQVREIYYLEREVARLKKLVPPIDEVDPVTGEVTRVNQETGEVVATSPTS